MLICADAVTAPNMMESAQLFALFLVLTVVLLALRRASWRPRFYYWPSVAVFAVLAVFTGYFAWRDHDSVRQLKALVDLPPYDRSVYVPRAAEIRTIARSLPANVPPNFPVTRQQNEQVRNELMSAKDLGTFWILETSSSPDSILYFYKNENHRKGWEITEQSRIHFVFRRQSSTLAIFFLDDFPRPGTTIVYILHETSGSGE
jgi:hypothetical protein